MIQCHTHIILKMKKENDEDEEIIGSFYDKELQKTEL